MIKGREVITGFISLATLSRCTGEGLVGGNQNELFGSVNGAVNKGSVSSVGIGWGCAVDGSDENGGLWSMCDGDGV